ncbi:hypothetical protein BD289DRAFT_276389 [Coniella lustricola]|uniref:Secreted protein n=1 Tax=Coniella lustricola TaxID=2025994 RepID=A0A2T3A6P2_9PEZI|nr:hypothetical protein BD289DRAFT_276389 [Coniella lustricola]
MLLASMLLCALIAMEKKKGSVEREKRTHAFFDSCIASDLGSTWASFTTRSLGSLLNASQRHKGGTMHFIHSTACKEIIRVCTYATVTVSARNTEIAVGQANQKKAHQIEIPVRIPQDLVSSRL